MFVYRLLSLKILQFHYEQLLVAHLAAITWLSTVESIFIIGTTISNDEVLSLGLEGYLMGRLELVAQVLRVCQAVAIVACENIARGHEFLI